MEDIGLKNEKKKQNRYIWYDEDTLLFYEIDIMKIGKKSMCHTLKV